MSYSIDRDTNCKLPSRETIERGLPGQGGLAGWPGSGPVRRGAPGGPGCCPGNVSGEIE